MKAKFGKAVHIGRPLQDQEATAFNALAMSWDWYQASKLARIAVSIRGMRLVFINQVVITCASAVNYIALYGDRQVISLMLEHEFVPQNDRTLVIAAGTEVEICSSGST